MSTKYAQPARRLACVGMQDPVVERPPERTAALDVARSRARPGGSRDCVDDCAEGDRPEQDEHSSVPGLHGHQERDHEHPVEEEARIRR